MDGWQARAGWYIFWGPIVKRAMIMTIELLQKNVLIQIRVEPIAEFADLKKPSFFL